MIKKSAYIKYKKNDYEETKNLDSNIIDIYEKKKVNILVLIFLMLIMTVFAYLYAMNYINKYCDYYTHINVTGIAMSLLPYIISAAILLYLVIQHEPTHKYKLNKNGITAVEERNCCIVPNEVQISRNVYLQCLIAPFKKHIIYGILLLSMSLWKPESIWIILIYFGMSIFSCAKDLYDVWMISKYPEKSTVEMLSTKNKKGKYSSLGYIITYEEN